VGGYAQSIGKFRNSQLPLAPKSGVSRFCISPLTVDVRESHRSNRQIWIYCSRMNVGEFLKWGCDGTHFFQINRPPLCGGAFGERTPVRGLCRCHPERRTRRANRIGRWFHAFCMSNARPVLLVLRTRSQSKDPYRPPRTRTLFDDAIGQRNRLPFRQPNLST
jgi:hypothetical protein